MGFRVGIDVGGTFTDFLLQSPDGQTCVHKTSTTPTDPSEGVFDGLAELARSQRLSLGELLHHVDVVVHGTTVTTNALLTEQGATTALLTTRGFIDALQMRRGIRESQYDNKYLAPTPLVPRRDRIGVEERVDATGSVVTPLNEADVQAAVQHLAREGIQAVAICFLHAWANPTHERQAADLVRQQLPHCYLSISSSVLPQVRFYDRTSTTVLNAYVGPILGRYLSRLTTRFAEAGFGGVLLVMQSNGGVTTPEVATQCAASTLLSGPAAGPVAGGFFASAHGHRDCITVDMGGTSFDAALVKDGAALGTTEGRIHHHLLALPMLDIHTIGAGGGSIGWIDEGGLLRMGPQSAGARPGPVCYGRGGTRPTCTDADLILGYLNPDFFLGGRMKLDKRDAAQAILRVIGEPLGLSVEEAAAGMVRVINVNMAAGVRKVTIERGYDPRDFPLVVAGGAGPVHGAMIALELEIPVVIVPRISSIFCAAGMLMSDLQHDYGRTYHVPLAELDPHRLRALVEEMAEVGHEILRKERIPPEQARIQCLADLRYLGQYHEIKVPLSREEVLGGNLSGLAERFHQAHDRLYGYSLPESPLELLNIRVTLLGVTEKPSFQGEPYAGVSAEAARSGEREIFLPGEKKFRSVPVYDGHALRHGNRFEGPAVVELSTTTVVVPEEFDVECDRLGSLVLGRR